MSDVAGGGSEDEGVDDTTDDGVTKGAPRNPRRARCEDDGSIPTKTMLIDDKC